ncbi:universal stress protein [Pseudonocardia sp. GCM10023141]|uniref:universal stress protein n=1 Tax=Pseudonocardia sp. GCM10023141 TaxID=3252653 RepID=UPI003606A99D
MNDIVAVGVDGSPASRTALEYAVAEAARRRGRLRVIVGVRPPEYWAMAYGLAAPASTPDLLDQARAEAHAMLDEVLASRPADAHVLHTTVEAHAGIPAEVLVEASREADVLVVGHRGRGGLASTLLGSVGLHCVLHACCPVTIVRGTPVAETMVAEPAMVTDRS